MLKELKPPGNHQLCHGMLTLATSCQKFNCVICDFIDFIQFIERVGIVLIQVMVPVEVKQQITKQEKI